ncbi:regenerating islet-derived protein 3-gamma-like [Suncus etruscus]|uniref:regenerating islet-derived protein 3-gamma-like n=1 Tax=Suncus etruscus TaxID=109475 RepID=UPI002110C42F|nr:regenerating islet-derived protein 3-gamma-like [Suncus etruscus]
MKGLKRMLRKALTSDTLVHPLLESGEHLLVSTANPGLGCPNGFLSYSSHCYAFFMTPSTWMQASMDCQKWPSGQLVSVLSESEASFVASLIKNSINNYYYVWIGLYDPTEGKQDDAIGWEWSSTDQLKYHAWEVTPPSLPDSGYCGIVTESSGFRKWKDYNCNLKLPYVCKFKL